MTFKVVHLFSDSGELGRLPDGGIINAGGVSGNTFTVGGKGLLFSDGTSTDGSPVNLNLTLQGAYNFGSGTIDFSAGKNFVISALNQKIFQVDAATGRVTITGDLTVLGSSTVVESTLANVDQVSINPPAGVTSGLLIEPMVGITMSTDLVRIRNVNSGPPVFTIDASGNTFLKQLTVGGTINGIDLAQFYSDFQNHINGSGIKHAATEVSVDETNLQNVSGSTVQEVVESIDSAIGGLSGNSGVVQAYEHFQSTPSQTWTVLHAKNSTRPNVSIFDEVNDQVLPDEVKILDNNTIQVLFNTPQAGRAIILLF